MDRERQTLELLTLLGDDVAEAVLGRLQPDRAEKLRASLKGDAALRSTISRQREVLDEFECFFQFALRSRPPETTVLSEGDSPEPKDPGSDSAAPAGDDASSTASGTAEVSSGTYGSDAAIAAAKSEGPTSESTTSNSGDAEDNSNTDSGSAGGQSADNPGLTADSPSNASDEPTEESMTTSANTADPLTDPLNSLQTLSVYQIAEALASEQSRTTAILLSNLPAKLTGEVLNLLKPDYQKAVMKELTREQHAPPVLVERIARATFSRASQLSPDPPDSREHADKVAEMLRSVPKAGRRNMLAAIEEQDPDLAKSLLTRIYRFDDIASLSKSVVQRVLGEVDSTNLTTALYGAPESLKEAIFVNLSKRARQTIEEEMQFMTNVAESRIKQARDAIAEIIAKIDMEGEQ